MNKLCLLPSLGVLKISGKEAAEFLQGQITADVKQCPELSPLGAHCLPNGKIVFLFRLFQWQANYYLLMPQSMLALAQKSLGKYAAFSDCTISIESLSILGVIGIEACSAITSPKEVIILTLQKEDPRRICIGDKDWMNKIINETKIPLGTLEDWQHQDILNGIPTLSPETSEVFLPHRIGLPEIDAVSFNKGCYIGQEIIARTQYRATPKYKVMCFKSNSRLPLTPGKPMSTTNKEAGVCINAQYYQNNTEGLAIMPIDTLENTVLKIDKTSIHFSAPLYANKKNEKVS
jgi:folate-binding protein YgfZ